MIWSVIGGVLSCGSEPGFSCGHRHTGIWITSRCLCHCSKYQSRFLIRSSPDHAWPCCYRSSAAKRRYMGTCNRHPRLVRSMLNNLFFVGLFWQNTPQINYQFSPYVAEMANTLSNLFSIALALHGLLEVQREHLPKRYAAGYLVISCFQSILSQHSITRFFLRGWCLWVQAAWLSTPPSCSVHNSRMSFLWSTLALLACISSLTTGLGSN